MSKKKQIKALEKRIAKLERKASLWSWTQFEGYPAQTRQVPFQPPPYRPAYSPQTTWTRAS